MSASSSLEQALAAVRRCEADMHAQTRARVSVNSYTGASTG